MNREYHHLVFTKHALERLTQRSISQDAVERVLAHPDRTHPTGKAQTSKFIRELNGRVIHVVGTYLPDQKKWLIVSVWVRGEDDQLPLVWQIISLPFKLLWWLLKQLFAHTKRSSK
jgi:hypothetical protein